MSDGTGFESLLRAREDAERALERGDDEIEYRGYRIDIEDDVRGWTYHLDGQDYGESLEDCFQEIDRRSGTTEGEIEGLAAALGENRKRRDD